MSGVAIDVHANSQPAERDLAKIEKSLANIRGSADRATEALATIGKSIAIAAAAASGFAYISKITDQFTNLSNRIALVTGRTDELTKAQQGLLDVTFRSRATIEGSATAFSTLGKAMKNTGASTQSLLKVTETINQAIAISGSSAESANAAIIQLGQGLASGVLRGEEFNSIMEQTPRLAQALADSLGLTLGQLRAISQEGKLTTDVVFKGLLGQAEQINKEFKVLAPTMRQGFGALKQAAAESTNELAKGIGINEKVAQMMINMAAALRDKAQGLGVTAAIFMANVRTLLSGFEAIARPVSHILSALGQQLLAAVPKFWFSHTFIGDIQYALTRTDTAFGRWIVKTRLDFLALGDTLFTWDGPIEKAIKRMKRLTPTYWLREGVNAGQLRAFFNIDTLYMYADALQSLADGLQKQLHSLSSVYRNWGRDVRAGVHSFLMYFGLMQDTVVRMKIGYVDPLIKSIAAVIRGITGMSVQLLDISRLTAEALGDSYVGILNALVDAAKVAPGFIAKTFQTIIIAVIKFTKAMALMVSNAWHNMFYGLEAGMILAVHKISDAFDKMSGRSKALEFFQDVIAAAHRMAAEAVPAIKQFAKDVIQYFFEIWDAVIGHSWWTDTVESVVNTSKTLWDDVKRPLNKFKNAVITLFEDIWDSVSGLKGWKSMLGSMVSNIASFGKSLVPGFETSKKVVASALDDLGDMFNPKNVFDRLERWYARGFISRKIAYALTPDPTVMQSALHYFDQFCSQTVLTALEMASKADRIITKFCKKVIHEFFVIYDDVIAHSWWTDTMDAIVDQAKSLAPRTEQAFKSFKDTVAKFFRSITGNATFGDKIVDNLKGMKDLLGGIASSFGDGLKKSLLVFKEQGPEILQAIGAGLLGMVALALPLGKFKALIVTELVTSFLVAASLISEEFSKNVFGFHFTVEAGKALGRIVGYFVAHFIAEIPSMLDALLGVVTGFVQGFLSQMPILGNAIRSVFDVASFFNLAGPLGLFGLYFFGKDALGLLARIESINPAIQRIQGAVNWIQGFTRGTEGGAIGQFLFGHLGTTRIVSGIGVILTSLGAFDSLFGNSYLLKIATEGGLLAMMIGGDKAKNMMSDKFYQYLVEPALHGMQELSKKVNLGRIFDNATGFPRQGTLHDLLFGGQGSSVPYIEEARKFASKIYEKVIDTAAEYTSKVTEPLKTLLLGPDPDATIQKFKDAFKKGLQYVRVQYLLLQRQISRMNLFATMTSGMAGAGAGLTGLGAKIGGFISGIFTNANASAARVAGSNGLLGTLFFGKYGRMALLGIILATIAGFASASENQTAESINKSYTVFDSLNSQLKESFRNHPYMTFIGTLAAGVATLTVAFTALAYAILPRQMLPGVFARATSVASFFGVIAKDIGKGFITAFDKVALGLKTLISPEVIRAVQQQMAKISAMVAANSGRIKATAVGAAVGGAAAAIANGSTDDIMAMTAMGAALANIFMMIPATVRASMAASLATLRVTVGSAIGLFGMVGAAAEGMWLAITGPVGLVIAGLAAVGAALLGIFGEGDTFLEKLDNLVNKILQGLGFVEKGKTRLQEKLEKSIPESHREFGQVKVAPGDFSSLDFAKLPESFKDDLVAVNDKLVEAVNTGFKEQNQLGHVQATTLENIRELTKARDNKIQQGRALSAKDIPTIIKDLNESNQIQASKWDFITKFKQMGRDADLRMQRKDLEEALKKNPGNMAAIKALDRIKERGNKDYKVDYRFEDEWTKRVQEMMDKIGNPDAELINENQSKTRQNELIALKKNWSDSVVNFDKMSKNFAKVTADISQGGTFHAFSGTNADIRAAGLNRDSARAELELLTRKFLDEVEKRRKIDALTTQQSDFEANLSKSGTTIDSPLFTLGQGVGDQFAESIDQFTRDAKDLVQLSNNIKEQTTYYARLQAYLQKRDKEIDVLLRANHAKDINTLNPGQLMGKAVNDAGLGVDANLLSGVDPKIQVNLARIAQEVETARKELEKSANIVNPFDSQDNQDVASVTYRQNQANLATAQNKFYAQIEELLNGDSKNQHFAMQTLGINIPDSYYFANGKDQQQYRDTAKQYARLTRDLQNPTTYGNQFATVQKYAGDLKYWLDSMAPIGDNLQGLIQKLSTLHVELTPAQIASLKPDTRDELSKLFEQYRQNDFQLKRPGNSDLSADQRASLDKANREILLQAASIARTAPKSLNDKISDLRSLGVNIDLQKALQAPPKVLDDLLGMGNKLKEYQEALSKEFIDPQQLAVIQAVMPDVLIKFKRLSDDLMTFAERLDFVNTNLTGSNVTLDEWNRMTEKQRREMFDTARANRDDQDLLHLTKDPKEAAAIAKRLKDRNFDNLSNPGRDLALNTITRLNSIGINADESVVGRMKPSDQKDFLTKATNIGLDKQKLNGLTPDARAALQAVIDKSIDDLNKQFNAAIVTDGFKRLNLAGANISEEAYNMVRDKDRILLDNMVAAIEDSKKTLATPGLPEKARIAAQNILNKTQSELGYALSRVTLTRETSPAYLAGQDLASTMYQSMASGIGDFLKGKMSGKDLFSNLLDTFTSSVVDKFVGGMMNAVTGKDGMMSKIFGGIGEGVFGLGQSLFGGSTQNEKDWAASAMKEASIAMNNLVVTLQQAFGLKSPLIGTTNTGDAPTGDGDALKSGIDGMSEKLASSQSDFAKSLGDTIKNLSGSITTGLQGLMSVMIPGGGSTNWLGLVAQGISAYYGANTGGAEGALSSAPQASYANVDYLKTAGSFNSSFNFPQHALGGVVAGGRGMPQPVIAHGGEVILNAAQQNALLHGGGGKTEATFNLHITGDVSTQTRQEIAKMIPQIASGVNQQNLERGRY